MSFTQSTQEARLDDCPASGFGGSNGIDLLVSNPSSRFCRRCEGVPAVPSALAPQSLFDCARYGYRAAARGIGSMECVGCGSAAVSERSECTAQGYRRFRCRACGKQFNERSAGVLNRTQYPSDIIALVVLLAPALQAC